MDLEYFIDLIISKKCELEKYISFYNTENWQELFNLALEDDLEDIVEFLYRNKDCKYYLNSYTDRMDQDLLQHLNDDKRINEGYKLVYKSVDNASHKLLLEMRRYSKCKRDEQGFYYIFSKK